MLIISDCEIFTLFYILPNPKQCPFRCQRMHPKWRTHRKMKRSCWLINSFFSIVSHTTCYRWLFTPLAEESLASIPNVVDSVEGELFLVKTFERDVFSLKLWFILTCFFDDSADSCCCCFMGTPLILSNSIRNTFSFSLHGRDVNELDGDTVGSVDCGCWTLAMGGRTEPAAGTASSLDCGL